MRLIAPIVLTLALLMGPTDAVAWGVRGHQVIAELAQRQLKPAALAQVDRLLAGEAVPTLAGIANWADEQRALPGTSARHSRWHYVNFDSSDCSYVPARDCPDGDCVIAAINRNLLVLADATRADAERRDALKFLVHLVGDIHQPLHSSPHGDRGGGDYQINYRGQGRNLHSVWDVLVLEPGHEARQYADRLQLQSPLPADATQRSDRRAVDWAVESCRLIATAGIYPSGHVIDDRYLLDHRPLAERRLRQAANRLADLLNHALAGPASR